MLNRINLSAIILLMVLNCHAQKNADLIGTWVMYKIGKASELIYFKDTLIINNGTTFEERIVSYNDSHEVALAYRIKGGYENTGQELVLKELVSIPSNGEPRKIPDQTRKYKLEKGKLIFIEKKEIKVGNEFRDSGETVLRYFRKMKATKKP